MLMILTCLEQYCGGLLHSFVYMETICQACDAVTRQITIDYYCVMCNGEMGRPTPPQSLPTCDLTHTKISSLI